MSRRALLLLLAGGIVIFTILLLRSRVSEPPGTAAVPMQSTRVVIAKHDLAVGSFVQGLQDLDWGTIPDVQSTTAAAASTPPSPNSVPTSSELPLPGGTPKENYLYEGSVKLTDFNGAVVRRSLHAGDPVPQFAIMKSGEGGFMSAVLEPGMRAVSIGVNATSGNAGFVSPGDRIDLIVTHRIKVPQAAGGGTNDEFIVSETFVRNVRVVAVDQMLDNPESKAILAKTVTVEVNPRQAEEIAVAADLGKISIALRSLSSPDARLKNTAGAPQDAGDVVNVDHAGDFTRDSDISELLMNHQPAQAGAGTRVHVIHGDKMENMDFDQGSK